MNNSKKTVVTRFAPSPTGFQHVGGIRTALYAWLWARKNNGTFILRIEDTDRERLVEGSQEHLIESLKWVGITWDEGPDIGGPHAPYLQSERLEIYKKYAQILIDKGYAYPDPYSEEEVEVLRKKAEEEKRAFLYRDYRPEKIDIWDGTKPLRFKVSEIKTYTWIDETRGELSAGPEALDDFILIKSDGYPTYNLAHIIDDLEMGVTHIMRSDEFISSTPKFLSLYEALGITPPVFVTLPPILGKEGTKKLGKRDGAKDVLDYRKEGYLPEAMINFLVLLGWNPGGDKEVMSVEELISLFDIAKIHKSGAMFNEEKLLWMNKEHIKRQTLDAQFQAIKLYMNEYDDEILRKLQPVIIEKISTYGELSFLKDVEFKFFIEAPTVHVEKVSWKDTENHITQAHLEKLCELLGAADFTSVEILKAAIMPYAEQVGKGTVLWPLRMSLSGQEKSVDPFTICYVLGKEETLTRITKVIDALRIQPASVSSG